MTRIAIVAAAAMLAAGIGTAGAQTSTTPSTSANQGKCWDSATNQIRDLTTTRMGSTGTGSTGSTTGGSMAGGSGSMINGRTGTSSSTGGSAGSMTGESGSASSTSQHRPAAAVGLPNC